MIDSICMNEEHEKLNTIGNAFLLLPVFQEYSHLKISG